MQTRFKEARKAGSLNPDLPTIMVSACVLGHEVRFDGGHKKQNYVVNRLSQVVNLVPFCPEAESGLGIPRESIRLVGGPEGLQAIGNRSEIDHTPALQRWSEAFIQSTDPNTINGVILKKGSPSCGLKRVRIYPSTAQGAIPKRDASGLFAQAFTEAFPFMPVSEEGWLNDTNLRESFLIQIFTDFRFKKVCETRSVHALLEFHAKHKFLLMAFSPAGQKKMGRILGAAKEQSWDSLTKAYQQEMIAALRVPPNRKRYSNALQHMAGYVKDIISNAGRQELAKAILLYADRRVSLDVPLSLIRHHSLNPRAPDYLKKQVYLSPYPINAFTEPAGVR
tara:strand:+ start:5637 stop:6644 length:1008 start_codon:yes stop_codon:yes gene_type:complete